MKEKETGFPVSGRGNLVKRRVLLAVIAIVGRIVWLVRIVRLLFEYF